MCRMVVLVIPELPSIIWRCPPSFLFDVLQCFRPCLETGIRLVDVVEPLPSLTLDLYSQEHCPLAITYLEEDNQIT